MELIGDGIIGTLVVAIPALLIWWAVKKWIENYDWPPEMKEKVDHYRQVTPSEWKFTDVLNRFHFFFDLEEECFFAYCSQKGDYKYTWFEVPFSEIESVVPTCLESQRWTEDHTVSGAIIGNQVGGSLGALAGIAAGRSQPYYYLDSLGYTIFFWIDDEIEDLPLVLTLGTDDSNVIKIYFEYFDRLGDLFREIGALS